MLGRGPDHPRERATVGIILGRKKRAKGWQSWGTCVARLTDGAAIITVRAGASLAVCWSLPRAIHESLSLLFV